MCHECVLGWFLHKQQNTSQSNQNVDIQRWGFFFLFSPDCCCWCFYCCCIRITVFQIRILCYVFFFAFFFFADNKHLTVVAACVLALSSPSILDGIVWYNDNGFIGLKMINKQMKDVDTQMRACVTVFWVRVYVCVCVRDRQ